jgi:glycosyltransferase involved in cell wall biosynthesis
MTDLVTLAIPIYKRLHFLPSVLKIVALQDYPNIELIVSDNGMNGAQVPALINQYYSGKFKFRQNPCTVSMSSHFNQIIEEASGKYFMILCDDDEISSNYVSDLVDQLERNPRASIALSKQEIMDESGTIIRKSSENLSPLLTGPEFIRGAWKTFTFNFECFATFLARTKDLKACGGYPEIHKGHSHDDALLVKLCLSNYVALSSNSTFRFRVYESSHGFSISIQDVAKATRDFFQFLNSDPQIQQFASAQPAEWEELKEIIGRMNWGCYYDRWNGLYRKRLTGSEWLKAAFALPFIPAYYRQVASTLRQASKAKLVYSVCRRKAASA